VFSLTKIKDKIIYFSVALCKKLLKLKQFHLFAFEIHKKKKNTKEIQMVK
jgi:hypothetical protein